jgi:hypothetical protein
LFQERKKRKICFFFVRGKEKKEKYVFFCSQVLAGKKKKKNMSVGRENHYSSSSRGTSGIAISLSELPSAGSFERIAS